MRSNRVSRGLTLAVLTFCAACGSVRGGASGMPFVVTEAEQARALELLAGQASFRSFTAEGPTYLVDTQVLNDKDAEGDRELLVTHYRTEGDLAIVSRVNLSRSEVVSIEPRAHLPVPLSREEFEIARQLALANPHVQRLIGGREVVVQSQLSRTFDTDDPLYGHRLVHILLLAPEGYLEVRTIRVDLTTREVTVEEGEQR